MLLNILDHHKASQPEQKEKATHTASSQLTNVLVSLWHLLLVILLPTALACLVLVPMISNTKSTQVDIRTTSSSIGFTLLSGWRSGQDVELLKSITSSSIRIWIDTVAVAGEALRVKHFGTPVEDEEWIYVARDSLGWLHLKSAKKNLILRSLYVDIKSRVCLRVHSRKLTVEVYPQNRVSGEIVLVSSENVLLNTYNSEFHRANDSLPPARVQRQERYELQGERVHLPFVSNRRIKIELDLDDATSQDLTDVFSSYLEVSDVSLVAADGGPVEPLLSGRATFRGIKRDSVNLGREFISLSLSDRIDLVSIHLDPEKLGTSLSGRLSSLRVGQTPKPDFEILPTWLEWVSEEQKLTILIGALAWLSGTILGAVKFLDALRKKEG